MKVLVVCESDEAMHDVVNGDKGEADNVVVTGRQHDRKNETSMIGTLRDGQATCHRYGMRVPQIMAPLSRAMISARCATHELRPFVHRDCSRIFRSMLIHVCGVDTQRYAISIRHEINAASSHTSEILR